MTINLADNTPRISYAVAEGVTQTSFAVPFEFFDDGDLKVYVDGTLKTITSDYTVSGGDGSTGTITISVTGVSGGSTVVITRDIPLARTTDFPTSGAFAVATLNRELDRFTAMQADRADDNDRSIKLKDQDATSSLELPLKADRAGRLLGFNATNGNAEAGPLITDVGSLTAITTDIATLADIEDGTDATDAIQTVAGISANVTTVAGISGNVTTVANNNANVTTVAGQTTNMQNVTDNLSAIQNASTNATNAANSATAAATSATNAATSETNAGTSETNASTSATAAATSATNAATSETNAGTSETNAATSATNAATSETNASTSETNAATSATNAATSATAASASQVAAAASAASAATVYDTFDDRYLGTKTSNPTVDNDGDALVEGALYFNSDANEMRVYDGANWIAASSAGTASLSNYHYTATAAQTTFSGADDNAATLSYTVNNLIVTLNGVVLEDGTDYTATNGTSVVLTSGAALNDEVNIVAFKSFTTADMVSATNGGTFQNDITINGDLTVDTNTLFVDSTNNNVGIGTSSISGKLTLGGDDDFEAITLRDNTASANMFSITSAEYSGVGSNPNKFTAINSSAISFETGGSEAMRIDSSGTVLVGNTSSIGTVVAGKIQTTGIQSFITTNSEVGGYIGINSNADNSLAIGADPDSDRAGSHIVFYVDGFSEKARIDGSNLLVGKTTTAIGTAGVRLITNGQIQATASNNEPFFANRLSSDGLLFDFRKDGTTVGSIQSSGGANLIVQGASAVVFKVSTTEIAYFDSVGLKPWLNNTYDIGTASARWRDIYTDGAVNTSDQNKKQQIETLTASEISAAKRISALFKKFKWNDAVTEKGDAARTHVGIIAQDVKSALEAEGLDATKYAFWCSNTWWETQTDVPAVAAVEAQDAVLDDDGNIVTEAVEAVEARDAYTRTDTYDTADEAPEGAVERTLQSVRYAELMAFVGAATEQRLTHLETLEARIEALENA